MTDEPTRGTGQVTDEERLEEERRYRHARALRPGRPDVVPTLLAYLGDPSWRVRKAAVAVLVHFEGEGELVPALVAGLASSDNAGLRNASAEALVSIGARALIDLSEALATPDPDHRKFIVEALGAVGTAAARDVLVRQLGDEDENVRAAVAEALGRIGGDEATRPLRQLLSAPDTDLLQRLYVLDALATSATRLSYDELVPWMNQRAVERQVFALLGLCGDQRAVQPLLDGITTPARETRAVVVRALATLASALSVEQLRAIGERLARQPARLNVEELLDDPDDAVVDASVRLLGLTDEPSVAPAVLAACACRPVVETGARVAAGLGRQVVEPLFEAFDTSDTESRVLFIEVIEAVGDATSVPQLLDIASGPDTRASEAALRAIGSLAGIEVIDKLMSVVQRGEPEIARAAAMALAAVGSRATDSVARAVRQAFAAGDQRPEWILVLGALTRDEDLDVIVQGTHHRDAEVRRTSIEAASSFGTRFPEAGLVLSLTDEQPPVRVAAAAALRAYPSTHVRDALLAAVRDPDPWVVAAALRSIGSVGGDRSVPTLMDAAQSNCSPIAIAALQSLFRINPPGLRSALDQAVTHADPEVVREAIAVSMRLSADSARDLLMPCLSSRFWLVRSAAAEALANRGIRVPRAVVQDLLLTEREPLAQESIERLLTASGDPV